MRRAKHNSAVGGEIADLGFGDCGGLQGRFGRIRIFAKAYAEIGGHRTTPLGKKKRIYRKEYNTIF